MKHFLVHDLLLNYDIILQMKLDDVYT